MKHNVTLTSLELIGNKAENEPTSREQIQEELREDKELQTKIDSCLDRNKDLTIFKQNNQDELNYYGDFTKLVVTKIPAG